MLRNTTFTWYKNIVYNILDRCLEHNASRNFTETVEKQAGLKECAMECSASDVCSAVRLSDDGDCDMFVSNDPSTLPADGHRWWMLSCDSAHEDDQRRMFHFFV